MQENDFARSFAQVVLWTDDMDIAGDIIQALCLFLNIEDLQVTADFPDEMDTLKNILIKVIGAFDPYFV